MIRYTLILLFFVIAFQSAQAQTDTLLYYLKNTGDIVEDKADADYFILITKPDSSSTTGLFPVYGFYANGKRKFAATSKVFSRQFILEGPIMQFFPNGRRKSIVSYSDGNPMGNDTQYYPNGKIYAIVQYNKDYTHQLIECRDSTGTMLAQNGEGKWLKYDEDFKQIIKEGPVKKGLENGDWHEIVGDSIERNCYYKNGLIQSGVSIKNNIAYRFEKTLTRPFTKDINAFKKALAPYYSALGKEKMRNNDTQGQAHLIFVVEVDGSITELKPAQEVSAELNEILISIATKLPKWQPGLEYGIPVRMYDGYHPPEATPAVLRGTTTHRMIKVPSGSPPPAIGSKVSEYQ